MDQCIFTHSLDIATTLSFARLARKPRTEAILCAIAVLLSINGCHAVPVASSTARTAIARTTPPHSELSPLARAQSFGDGAIIQTGGIHPAGETDDSPIPWGHVCAAHREHDFRDRFGEDGSKPGMPHTRCRLDLLPPSTGCMALTEFSNPIGGVCEPDWIEEAPSSAEPDHADFTPAAACHTINWRDDACQLFPMLWNDTKRMVNRRTAITLGVAAGGALAIRENLDGQVRDHTAADPLQWGQGSKVLRQFGEFQYQIPVIAGVYGLSLWTADEHLHEFSLSLISAYTLSSAATVAIKGITNTQRPTSAYQDGEYGFPSFHASTMFSIASVIDEYYGWQSGVPAYVLAGLVGWSRIDQREHDLSDVAFGAGLGFVIGKAVAAAHIERHSNMQIMPYYDPVQQTGGVQFEKRY